MSKGQITLIILGVGAVIAWRMFNNTIKTSGDAAVKVINAPFDIASNIAHSAYDELSNVGNWVEGMFDWGGDSIPEDKYAPSTLPEQLQQGGGYNVQQFDPGIFDQLRGLDK